MNKQFGKLYGLGLGPGDPELLTIKALRILQEVDIIFTAVSKQSSNSVSSRIIRELPDIKAEKVELVFAMRNTQSRAKMISENTEIILSYIAAGKTCAYTTIGDPLTYSTFGYIMKEINQHNNLIEIEVVPGVNSWSALAAQTKTILVEDLEALKIIPAYYHDAPNINTDNDSLETKVYLKTYRSKNILLEKLQSKNKSVLYGSNIGLEKEFITTDIETVKARDDEYLSMMIVKNEENKK
jgi:precorrin-2/cobalt-factor-2 C20-methyltransferase